jgi:hypothetical protein
MRNPSYLLYIATPEALGLSGDRWNPWVLFNDFNDPSAAHQEARYLRRAYHGHLFAVVPVERRPKPFGPQQAAITDAEIYTIAERTPVDSPIDDIIWGSDDGVDHSPNDGCWVPCKHWLSLDTINDYLEQRS